VLGDLPGDAPHLCQIARKYVLVVAEEVDELAFLFGVQADPNWNGFGRVFSVDLHGLGVLGRFESAKRWGHGRAEQRLWYSKAQLS
jgi:hypothetical protein